MTTLRYRGVAYDAATHEQPSDAPVDHVYRGHHYTTALLHEAAEQDTSAELHYRGHVYSHRSEEAARQVDQA